MVLDFFGLAQDYPTKRRVLLERVRKVITACRNREECTLRLFKVILNFIEKSPEENLKVVASIISSLPSDYAENIVRLVEALSSEKRTPSQLEIGEANLRKVLDGNVSCVDLENIPYLLEETKDFMIVAFALAILEKSGELKDCGKTFARSILFLTRTLYERGYGDLAASILKKYSIKIFIHKFGKEIKGIKMMIGNNTVIDLTDVMSLIYQDISAMIELGYSSSKTS